MVRTIHDPKEYDNSICTGIPVIGNIPHLPSSSFSESLLKRIQFEFSAISERRGYKISSVTELCCCDDGINHTLTSRRQCNCKKVSDNILGYNFNRREIYLRLRKPHTHDFFAYEDVATTMCHEMAHCEISTHNEKILCPYGRN